MNEPPRPMPDPTPIFTATRSTPQGAAGGAGTDGAGSPRGHVLVRCRPVWLAPAQRETPITLSPVWLAPARRETPISVSPVWLSLPTAKPRLLSSGEPSHATEQCGSLSGMRHGYSARLQLCQSAWRPWLPQHRVMPPYAWPTYAPYDNFSRVATPLAYPYNSFPYIGPCLSVSQNSSWLAFSNA